MNKRMKIISNLLFILAIFFLFSSLMFINFFFSYFKTFSSLDYELRYHILCFIYFFHLHFFLSRNNPRKNEAKKIESEVWKTFKIKILQWIFNLIQKNLCDPKNKDGKIGERENKCFEIIRSENWKADAGKWKEIWIKKCLNIFLCTNVWDVIQNRIGIKLISTQILCRNKTAFILNRVASPYSQFC